MVRNGVVGRRVRSWRSWNRLEAGSKKGRSRGGLLLNPSLIGILRLGYVPVRNRSVREKGLLLLLLLMMMMGPFR